MLFGIELEDMRIQMSQIEVFPGDLQVIGEQTRQSNVQIGKGIKQIDGIQVFEETIE